MALYLSVTKSVYGQNVTIPNAYHRIERLEGNKDEIEFELSTYDENAEHLVESKFYRFTPSVEDDSPNFIKQGYEYLKTLPNFIGAFDC